MIFCSMTNGAEACVMHFLVFFPFFRILFLRIEIPCFVEFSFLFWSCGRVSKFDF